MLVSKGMNNAEAQWGQEASEKSQQEVSEVLGASKVPGQTILIQLPTRVSGWPSSDISARFTKPQTSNFLGLTDPCISLTWGLSRHSGLLNSQVLGDFPQGPSLLTQVPAENTGTPPPLH